jgi:hypothetical protein
VAALRERKAGCAPPSTGCCPQPSLTERDIAHIWEGQRFPPQALATVDGQPLTVLYRGLPGRGPGPDFRDAVIETPRTILRGDVELHLRASDFRRHGHHRDPAYDGLALHFVYWADEGPSTLLASGRRVALAALAPWVEHRSGEIRRWLERPALWREPCRSAPARMGDAAVAAVLDRLGDIRFRRRTAELRRALRREDPEEVLFGALLEAIGCGGNREAFRLLALRLPWRGLRAALLSVPVEGRVAFALEALRAAAKGPPPLAWRSAGLRPGNQPARRLEGAALLLAPHVEAGLASGLTAVLEGDPAGAVARLTVREGRALIGAARALEVLTNAVLPFLAAGGGDGRARAVELYRALPRPAAYGAVRHLDDALGGAVRVDARRQQGMLFLRRHYCTQGRCGRCPLS